MSVLSPPFHLKGNFYKMRSDNVEEARSILQGTARIFHPNIMTRSLCIDTKQESHLFLSSFHFKLVD